MLQKYLSSTRGALIQEDKSLRTHKSATTKKKKSRMFAEVRGHGWCFKAAINAELQIHNEAELKQPWNKDGSGAVEARPL